MIGVAVQPDRLATVAEFFELFKTPWQTFAGSGDDCTLLLSDGTELPDNAPPLCILFSPDYQPGDAPSAGSSTPPEHGFFVRTPAGSSLPIYTACRFFQTLEKPLLSDASGRTAAYAKTESGRTVVRVGYDLFDEMTFLLSAGQPAANAGTASLDRHIEFLRRCILDAGLPVFEVPPAPPDHPYMVCLTHDVDFVSIRSHGLNSTVMGFVRRALFGSLKRVRRGSLSRSGLLKNFAAVFCLPLVHLRLMKDFWMQFEAYRRMEEPNRSTFFLIPFKNRPGEGVTEPYPHRRATRYDVEDVRGEVQPLLDAGWEAGLHGIDAWRDADCGRAEKKRIESVLGRSARGVRMHWLCRNVHTDRLLDEAGFEYDATCGYNETVGFRAGTSQVFRPLCAERLLEVPLHIQDVALFYPAFLDLTEAAAWKRCEAVLHECRSHCGVLTVLWHMRSLAPERLWGGFYARLLERFRRDGAWIGTAAEAAERFRARRSVRLDRRVAPDGETVICLSGLDGVAMRFRMHHPVGFDEGCIPQVSEVVLEADGEIQTGFYDEAAAGPEARAV